jgi:PPOX class probable F420-dependent enzyme
MPQAIPAEVKQLLERPNFVHLCTLMPDGSPQSVPVWAGVEGEHILICTGEQSLKARNTLRDNRVALSVVDFDNPYEEAQIRGRVVEHGRTGSSAIWTRSPTNTRASRFLSAVRRVASR